MSENPGGGRPRAVPQVIRLNIALPLSDLNLSDKSKAPIPLAAEQFLLGLVLPYGMGPDEPHLFQVDAAGNLKVAGPGSAAALAAQSANGAQLQLPPSEWSIQHSPAAGAQATISRAAGAAGVRHVARRVSFGFSSQAALPGVSTVQFNLRDGATGAGAILKSWIFDLPAAIIGPLVWGVEENSIGSAATALTLEMAAAVAGLRGFVNLGGVDAS